MRPTVSGSIEYQPNGNNNIRFNYSQKNNLPDLYNAIDTLNISFNSRLLGIQDINNTVSSSSEMTVGYYNSNTSKARNYNISYTHGVDYDYIEPIFTNILNNVFFYTNFLINKKTSDKIEINIGKGFYFTEK